MWDKFLQFTRSGAGVAMIIFGLVGLLAGSSTLKNGITFWKVLKLFLLGDLVALGCFGILFLFVYFCIDPNDSGGEF